MIEKIPQARPSIRREEKTPEEEIKWLRWQRNMLIAALAFMTSLAVFNFALFRTLLSVVTKGQP